MATIPEELNEKISKNPDNDYSVLITLKDENLPPALKDKGNFIMGNKIFSAKISGKEIKQFADHSQIDAIEPDMEMGIL